MSKDRPYTTDFLGNTIAVKDFVVALEGKYKNLAYGVVKKITPSGQMRLVFGRKNSGDIWEKLCWPSQVVKIINTSFFENPEDEFRAHQLYKDLRAYAQVD